VLARLRAHATLGVDVFDRSARTRIATGQLLALDNQIDTTTGTVKVRAQFDNKDNALFPNQFVNTRLLVNTLQGVTLIPAAAVQQNGSAAFVYVIQNNTAGLRTIKAGVTDGGVTQVDGIQPGDVVATSGFDKLQDKAKVVVAASPPAPAAAGASSGTSGTQAP
jgi:multidrug efflux system membrane fusion protein